MSDSTRTEFDVIVIGSGPGGQKAAVQAAKAGRRVAIIERERNLGGECVHHGTIPSKTLRTSAAMLSTLQRAAGTFDVSIREGFRISTLMSSLDRVVATHTTTTANQLDRNGVVRFHGVGRFAGPHAVEVLGLDGTRTKLTAAFVVIATGSRPRQPDGVPIDHEHVFDSDSILSMVYLPRSLTVLGGGVIATEWASIFQRLGVAVTQINRGRQPLAFLDDELNGCWVSAFVEDGGRYLGGREVDSMAWDGGNEVVTRLTSGEEVRSERALVAYGRVANLRGLNLEAAGLAPNKRGQLDVDRHLRTSAPHIYAAGDVAGPPALASSAMEQGRRAMCHALGLASSRAFDFIPVGIYTIPEISSVGMTEAEARDEHARVIVGRSKFCELARGQISNVDGLLKLISDGSGKLLGVQIVGDGATELIHVGQLALLQEATVDTFVENVFNFPTLAEAYRVAALDVVNQRRLPRRSTAMFRKAG